MKRIVLLAASLVVLACLWGCSASLLSHAAINGDLQEAKARIEQGDQVNEIDRWGWTPLMWSAYYGNFTVTKLLLENGADPNIKSETPYGSFLPGTTALILAAAYGRDDAVEALLKKNADPDIVDAKGKKAIDYATEYQFEKCIDLLAAKRNPGK